MQKASILNIKGLKVPAKIGVYTWEQSIYQTLVFDISIPIDIRRYQDDQPPALDYAEICQCIREFIGSRSFQLLETAAEQVLTLLQTKFAVTQISLTVTKPFAVPDAQAIQISLERSS